jgi:hypothetical protein
VLAEVQHRPLFVVRETYGGALRSFDEPILRVTEGSDKSAVTDVPAVAEAPERRERSA